MILDSLVSSVSPSSTLLGVSAGPLLCRIAGFLFHFSAVVDWGAPTVAYLYSVVYSLLTRVGRNLRDGTAIINPPPSTPSPIHNLSSGIDSTCSSLSDKKLFAQQKVIFEGDISKKLDWYQRTSLIAHVHIKRRYVTRGAT